MNRAHPRAGAPVGPAATRSADTTALRVVVWLALVVRLALFPFAENKQGDSPMRALIAERMNSDPAAAADPRSFCQFGPLPIELMRPFLAGDTDARRSSRLPSFLAGVLVFVPFLLLARRMVGGGPVLVLAALALALSPLHIQVSTTAASEAVYLLFLLAAFERLHAAITHRRRWNFLAAGVLMSLAAVTRYDSWVGVPAAGGAALLFGPRDRRALADVALFLCASAVLPVAYLGWSWMKSGDPFFFARYIAHDHATLARAVVARLGSGMARVRQVGIWMISFAAAMTPVAFLMLGLAAKGWRRWSPGTRVVLAAAMAPPGAYLAKGLLFGDFEPLPRFAIAPGAVLLPLAAAALLALAGRWPRLKPIPLLAGGAVLLSGVALVLAFARPGRIWGGAESIGPLTRLDAEDRAVAEHLLQHRRPEEGVFIDTGGYSDIVIAHAARVPAPRTATLSQTRERGPTLADSRRVTGASWFAIHDDSWGRDDIVGWPPDSLRFGRWRLAHVRADSEDAR